MTVNISFNLNEICRLYKINYADLSRRSGIDRAYLYNIQRRQSVSLKNLGRIAAALKVENPTELLTIEIEKRN